MSDKLRADVEKWCRAEAERYGCVLALQNSETYVTLDGPTDAFNIAFKVDGPHGPKFGWVSVDIKACSMGERPVRYEVQRLCEVLRSAAMVPKDVPVVGIGEPCPVHDDRFIRKVDWKKWAVWCGDPEVGEEHAIPDRVARWSGGCHTIERRPVEVEQ